MNRAYCSADEILDICKICLRNDKRRLEAIEASDRNNTCMVKARPIKRGSNEECDMFLTNIDTITRSR